MNIYTQIQDAAFTHADSRVAIVALIKKAGIADDKTRLAFIVGDMARQLVATKALNAGDNERKDAIAKAMESASVACELPSNTSKAKIKRTATQEKAYGASRAAWSRMVKRLGVKSESAKQGNTNAKPKARKESGATHATDKTESAQRQLVEVTPVCGNLGALIAALLLEAGQCEAIVKKNHSHATVQVRNLVNDFARGLRALNK